MGRHTPIHVEVEREDGMTNEQLIKRFIKKVKKSGVLDAHRESLVYIKPSDKKRKKKEKSEYLRRQGVKK